MLMKRSLYHGTKYIFDGKNINLKTSTRPKDFGNGFYLTSLYSQAKKWANKKKKFVECGIVKSYEYNEGLGNLALHTLFLNEYNDDWLTYILENRKSTKIENDEYDLVIGLMADGSTQNLINDYISGFIDKGDLLEELKFTNKNDQYAFKTEKSLKLLKFVGDDYI
jgi:Protein of unknown function (DUF3990)